MVVVPPYVALAVVGDLPLLLPALGGFGVALVALWRYRMKINFLWRVYERGGPADMAVAADALRRLPPLDTVENAEKPDQGAAGGGAST